MLTIFTTPKPFRGHIRIIQINAIRSWLILRPKCEVILLGDEEGTAEIASGFGIQHRPEVECNEYSTPLVSSIFSIAQDIASHQLMGYINADIILMSDFLPAVQQLDKPSFLMVGQRWDVELNESVNFDDTQWESQLWTHVIEHGKLHHKSGIDYFVFPRGIYCDIPPFALGRTAWDNWLVYRARLLKVPVIDATKAITAIHQNHGYPPRLKGKAGIWEGPEVIQNRELAKWGDVFTVDHVTLLLTPQGMKPALSIRHLYFRISSIPVLVPYLHFLNPIVKGLTKLIVFVLSIFRK